jgi:hypothetical protein
VKKLTRTHVVVLAVSMLAWPCAAYAQERGGLKPQPSTQIAQSQQPNVPAGAQRAEDTVERTVKRFRIGIFGGIGLDPELIEFGGQATFGPIFKRDVEFRPGLEFGLGELTTMFALNLDVLYALPGATGPTGWRPYIGAGPTFGLSHRGFETDDVDNVDADAPDDGNRFDFGDTDFNSGFNFIAGARTQGGAFFEMRATAGGVSNVRLLGGFNF